MKDWLVRRRWFVAAGGLFVVAVVVIVLVWPSSQGNGAYRPPTRARVYKSTTVCLLTGPQGVAGKDAASVWAGVQNAAGAANDQSEYLAAAVPTETVGSVTPFVNTLVNQHCDLIVATGSVEDSAVESIAANEPTVRFLLISGTSSSANVKIVSDSSASTVSAAVADDLGSQ